MKSSVINNLLKLARTIKVVGERRSIARTVERFVVQSEYGLLDFGSWHEVTGKENKLYKLVGNMISQLTKN